MIYEVLAIQILFGGKDIFMQRNIKENFINGKKHRKNF